MIAAAGAVTTALAVVVLVGAEYRSHRARIPAKLIASTGFLVVAVAGGAAGTPFGVWILAALGWSWLGDAFLLWPARFRAGLVSFLVAHLVFVAGFGVRGVAVGGLAAGAVLAVVPGIPIWRWLRPHLGPDLLSPVAAYVVVISLMVAFGIGTHAAAPDWRLAGAAPAFYASDIFVARNRFVAPGPANRLFGLPLYYGAQLLFAWAAGS